MNKVILTLLALLTLPALARFVPPSDPIHITSTNQHEYGIVVSVENTKSPCDLNEKEVFPESCSIWIEVPLVIKKDTFVGISLISRDPETLVTIPIHYTKSKRTLSHPQLPKIWVSKENMVASAYLCLPEDFLSKYIISIDYANADFYLEPETFLKNEKAPTQKLEPTR